MHIKDIPSHSFIQQLSSEPGSLGAEEPVKQTGKDQTELEGVASHQEHRHLKKYSNMYQITHRGKLHDAAWGRTKRQDLTPLGDGGVEKLDAGIGRRRCSALRDGRQDGGEKDNRGHVAQTEDHLEHLAQKVGVTGFGEWKVGIGEWVLEDNRVSQCIVDDLRRRAWFLKNGLKKKQTKKLKSNISALK